MNESTRAIGFITIHTHNKDDIEKLTRLINSTQANKKFNIKINPTKISNKIDNEFIKLPFEGIGKWSFKTNIQYLGQWINKELDTKSRHYPEYLITDRINLLSKHIPIIFEYTELTESSTVNKKIQILFEENTSKHLIEYI